MRSAEDLLDTIVTCAQDDPRVRAVLLNGSRANPNAKKDILQDFDIVYLVTEIDSFVKDQAWIARFGEPLIVQTPEDMVDPLPSRYDRYAYLMQFTDGHRIDLALTSWETFQSEPLDSLTVVLVDKDRRLASVPEPSEAGYVLSAPTEKAFADCCNEFLWVSTYVAKGLWRDEIVYAKVMFEQYVRPQALRVLDWYIGMGTGFTTNPGKLGKRYPQKLPEAMWTLVQQSYSDANISNSWAALHALNDVFRMASEAIAQGLGFPYPTREADNVRDFLKHLESLPKDAREVYGNQA